ncbi:hypothetical protein BLNAU_1730 [Blattamonas nauphoetae]|uniref:Uncharacterized protein n=1 Tax=Blattamonas nauphoetae TaxID=2049346 RepID=A0ABQ9YHG2_9EUKA|nr:hypothetical protein BLNAU_1730 [Blattamonas nauphoetae]
MEATSSTEPFTPTFPFDLFSKPLSSFPQHGNTYPDAELFHQEFEEEAKREHLRKEESKKKKRNSTRKAPNYIRTEITRPGPIDIENEIIPLPPGMPDDINLPVGEDILVNTGIVVTDKPLFHKQTHIFPLGLKYKYLYHCIVHPAEKHHYLCEIVNGGDRPFYKVTCLCRPTLQFFGPSATAAFKQVIAELQTTGKHKRETTSIRGTRCFGLTEDAVINIIRSLPGADELIEPKTKSDNSDF